jgi:hypothetical protein
MHGNKFMNSRYARESIVDGVFIKFKTGLMMMKIMSTIKK